MGGRSFFVGMSLFLFLKTSFATESFPQDCIVFSAASLRKKLAVKQLVMYSREVDLVVEKIVDKLVSRDQVVRVLLDIVVQQKAFYEKALDTIGAQKRNEAMKDLPIIVSLLYTDRLDLVKSLEDPLEKRSLTTAV